MVLSLDGTTSLQPNALRVHLDWQRFGSGDGSQLWARSGDVGIGRMDDTTVFHNGKQGGDGFGFAGLIDDVRIYDRVFASNEVEDLWLYY